MKTKVIMGILILLLVGGGFWGLNTANKSKPNEQTKILENSSESITKESTPPLINDQEGIQVSVEWEKLKGISYQQFLIGINNHVINVDNFDFTQNVKILLDNKEIPAIITVLEKNSSGHHLSAELKVESQEFTEVTPGSVMTLSITNLYDTPTRNFKWTF